MTEKLRILWKRGVVHLSIYLTKLWKSSLLFDSLNIIHFYSKTPWLINFSYTWQHEGSGGWRFGGWNFPKNGVHQKDGLGMNSKEAERPNSPWKLVIRSNRALDSLLRSRSKYLPGCTWSPKFKLGGAEVVIIIDKPTTLGCQINEPPPHPLAY